TVGILLGIVGCLLHFGGSAIYQLFSGLLSSLASSNVGGSNVQLSIADYVVLVLALTLALLGFVIGYLLFKQDMRSIGAKEMKRLITEQYQGSQSSSQNDFSKVLDIIQGRLECCGIDNFTDFYSASQWNRTYYLSSESRYVTLVAPLSCCQLSMTTFEPVDKNCTYNPTPSNSNYMKSCYGKLWDILTTYANVVMTGMAITAAITGCIAALAIIMLCYHIKNDVTPI
uniref:Tetraspanin n=1 Tax=Macrostomum lignano TaxID=282301 RepID=A0A1I8IT22_9PLAT